MMATFFEDIRIWVRRHATNYIETYFETLRTRREAHFHAHLVELSNAASYYHASPHANAIAAAHAELKRGVDEDWRSSVQKYPEVLEYYYSWVTFELPNDCEPGVRDPPLSALAGARAAPGRVRVGPPLEAERIIRRVDDRETDHRRHASHYRHGRGLNGGQLPGMEGLGLPHMVVMGHGDDNDIRQSARHPSRARSRSRSRHRSWSRRRRRSIRSHSRSRVRVVYEDPFDKLGLH